MAKKHIFDAGVDLKGSEIANVALQNLFIFPPSPSLGQILFRSDLNLGAYWDGTVWLYFGLSENVLAALNAANSPDGTNPFLTLDDLPVLVEDFIDLFDVPNAYTGAGLKAVRVKGTEDGLEFFLIVGIPPGGATGQVLGKASATDYAVSWIDQSGGIPDAPSDGNFYSRKDGAWTAFAPFVDAPSDGNFYSRKDGAWTAFSPFSVAGTPTEGDVVTSISGVPTWQAPSGGGGGNFIAFDVAQSLTGSQRQQALDNIGATSGAVETFTNSGVVTINDLVISKSNIEFRGASTVTLTGMVALWMGQEVTIWNETNNNLTLTLNNAGSSYINRFQNALVIPNRSFARVKYTALGGLTSWIITSTPFFVSTTGVGIYQLSSVGIGQLHEASVGLTVKTIGSVALRVNNLAGTLRIFEVQNTIIQSNIGHGFGGINPGNLAICVKPIASAIAIRIFDDTSNRTVDVMGNGNWQSLNGAFFGSSNTGLAPTARVDIRGRGTTTGNTLLLEDGAGTDNAIFVDNGQIRFLRLPISSAGLAANSLYIYDDGTRKYICIT